jgi:hypothetical protein
VTKDSLNSHDERAIHLPLLLLVLMPAEVHTKWAGAGIATN